MTKRNPDAEGAEDARRWLVSQARSANKKFTTEAVGNESETAEKSQCLTISVVDQWRCAPRKVAFASLA